MSLGGVRNLKLGVFLKDLSMWAAGERVLQNALPPAQAATLITLALKEILLAESRHRWQRLCFIPFLCQPQDKLCELFSSVHVPPTQQSVHTTGSSTNNH